MEESLDNVAAKSGNKQPERKPNDNEGEKKSEVRVCERVKNRTEENQREESQGGWGGQLELNQCVCPLCLINCLSGHHCKGY